MITPERLIAAINHPHIQEVLKALEWLGIPYAISFGWDGRFTDVVVRSGSETYQALVGEEGIHSFAHSKCIENAEELTLTGLLAAAFSPREAPFGEYVITTATSVYTNVDWTLVTPAMPPTPQVESSGLHLFRVPRPASPGTPLPAGE